MFQKQLGQRIAEIRRARNLTQVQIPKRLGYSVEFVCFVERGVNGPSIAGLEKFDKALKVNVQELFNFTGRRGSCAQPTS
jgi:transcriptional regulator with XRE-family HTH domain